MHSMGDEDRWKEWEVKEKESKRELSQDEEEWKFRERDY